jgi:hypothetical protein
MRARSLMDATCSALPLELTYVAADGRDQEALAARMGELEQRLSALFAAREHAMRLLEGGEVLGQQPWGRLIDAIADEQNIEGDLAALFGLRCAIAEASGIGAFVADASEPLQRAVDELDGLLAALGLQVAP